jgi:site-specific recombinase XerD
MLNLYRRHRTACPHRQAGRDWVRCACPIWCDGEAGGRRVRQTLKTRDWQRALRRMAELENPQPGGIVSKAVADAVDAFLEQKGGAQPATLRKYKRLLGALGKFASHRGLAAVSGIRLEDLDGYRKGRGVNALTWSKELQLLRQFFAFCQRRHWCEENPAKDMEMPGDPKSAPREPYTAEEVARILAACETFGKGPYERARARAAILLMRYYGLRVSDVATLERARVRGGQIFLHALKNGAPLWLPLYQEVEFALACLPAPKGAADARYFFWSGEGSRENQINTVGRTLQAVFAKSGVSGAHAHRFRHTLSTEILVSGGSIEDAANILGDSPAIIRKHYLKWSTAYQRRTVEVLARIHGTSTVHEKNLPVPPRTERVYLGARGGT